MSENKELRRLEQEKKDAIKEIRERLDKELIPKRTSLEERGKELLKRTSSLAQTLQAKNKKELEELQRRIKEETETLNLMTEQLREVQAQIIAIAIQEQVNQMVPKLIEWITANSENIGYDITRTFNIDGITKATGAGFYWGYTGEIGIFEINNFHELILSSESFGFHQDCYTVEFPSDGRCIVRKTDWFVQFLEDFRNAFFKELKASYNLKDLRLTIESPNFTLELV